MIFNASMPWTLPRGFPMPCKAIDLDTGEVVPLVLTYDSSSQTLVRKPGPSGGTPIIEKRRLRFEGIVHDVERGKVKMIFNPFGRSESIPCHKR
jgi:hypothetical protein